MKAGLGAVFSRPMALWNSRRTLWLLVKRDLKVRYADSMLGYLWSILDPLLMSMVYLVVFGMIFKRGVGETPYIIFLLVALLPWTWFQNCVGDASRALRRDSRLVRSTRLPREIWPMRVVLSKAVEFGFSVPVLLVFVLFNINNLQFNAGLWLFPVAFIMQFLLLSGLALLLSPLQTLFRDVDPLIRIAMRVLFYASPILYGLADVQDVASFPDWAKTLYSFNPVCGIISAYRAGFFANAYDPGAIVIAACASVITLIVGWIVFAKCERSILKEL